MGKTLSPASL